LNQHRQISKARRCGTDSSPRNSTRFTGSIR
jgi:hypothetical protein